MRIGGAVRGLAVLALLILAWPGGGAAAADPLRVVVSFSILADMVGQIGAGDTAVASLIGPDADAHVFEPSPREARLLARAQLVIVNGLGLEGWLTRLVQSAQYRGSVVVATEGILPLAKMGAPDPHAWQDVQNAIVYAGNIAQALAQADPDHADAYRRRAGRYEAALAALDHRVHDELAAVPAGRRRVITTHDAFAYYGRAYGVAFMAPEGVSTDSEPSAQAIAGLIRQIRREHTSALFLENISDPRLMQALARETGATLGPPLYSDALSRPDGPAPSYIRMIEYNTAALKAGMLKN